MSEITHVGLMIQAAGGSLDEMLYGIQAIISRHSKPTFQTCSITTTALPRVLSRLSLFLRCCTGLAGDDTCSLNASLCNTIIKNSA